MNKRYVILIMYLIGVMISQISFAETFLSTDNILYEKAEASLKNRDTLEACNIYRRLKAETDSIAQINYQNEVKAKRTTYQIDELYLENKLQEGIILRKISLFLSILAFLLLSAFYYLRTRNRKLEQARLKARQLQEEAERSLQKKSELLYTISKDMTESLNEMRKITANLQTTDTASSKEVHNSLSGLRSSAEKLQNMYNLIFS